MFRQVVYADGALYVVGNAGYWNASNSTTGFGWNYARFGFNLGSRVKLGSSKTKLNTETMKITYDITLPGWF